MDILVTDYLGISMMRKPVDPIERKTPENE
jgi:hypothetical protein